MKLQDTPTTNKIVRFYSTPETVSGKKDTFALNLHLKERPIFAT